MAEHVQVVINDTVYWVDSKLEARMLLWLENNGFSGRWRRPEKGLNVGKWNYTPDVELFIQHDGKMLLALVEIKQVLHDNRYGFSKYIFERMRRAARVYFATMLLLYVDDEKAWYRIDYKTGKLTVFGRPVPAEKTIDQAYRPLTVGARKIYYHEYIKRVELYGLTAFVNLWANGLEGALQYLTRPMNTYSRRRRAAPFRRRDLRRY